MPTVKLNGVEIYFEIQGSGEPVLLVPPNWWPCATWNVGVVPVLSKRFRTIIYDGRGTGRSAKPAEGYSVRQFALDGIELLQQLGVSRCHLVGFAIGGQIVQAMAIERPELVASLTISTTGPGVRRLDGTMREVGPEALDEINKIGFEKYILEHIDNDHMAYNPEFYRSHRRTGRRAGTGALVRAEHGRAVSRSRTGAANLGHVGGSAEGKSADVGSLRRGRRRRAARQHAGSDGAATGAVDSRR